jgi:hypothetical protein
LHSGGWNWKITGLRTAIVDTPFYPDGKISTWRAELKFDETFSRLEGVATDTNHHGHYTGRRLGKLASSSAFEKALLRNRWTWSIPGSVNERIFFQQGGIVVNPGHWAGHWEMKDEGIRSIVIHAPFQTGSSTVTDVVLSFDPGLTKFSASDGSKFEGVANGSNQIETFAGDFLNITNFILAPLDQIPPDDLRNKVVRLKEGLKDEATTDPQAVPAAYAIGASLCDTLVGSLEQRENYIRRLTGGALLPKGVPDSWAKDWAQMGVGMRRIIETQYGQFRDGVRARPNTFLTKPQ